MLLLDSRSKPAPARGAGVTTSTTEVERVETGD